MLPSARQEPQLPPLLGQEFKYVNRYWDNSNKAFAAKITPGEYYVSKSGELVTTVLGSCVSACIRDPRTGIGGMNHFMLPRVSSCETSSWNTKLLSTAARYGNVAMERLINTILVNGGTRNELECKVFGGARVLNLDSDVGNKNIEFVTEYLKVEGLEIQSYDMGGPYPRKVIYYPKTGMVRLKKLKSIQGSTLQMRERAYSKRLQERPFANEVTLFD
jgi:chemotaxis protein CheD